VHSLLSRKWWAIALSVFAMLVMLANYALDLIGLPWNWLSLARFTAIFFVMALMYLFGNSKYGSMWRRLWRRFPTLNEKLFPDLNGIWIGTTSSNWPIIKKMKDPSIKNESSKKQEGDTLGLQENTIVIEIKASLISIKISSYLESTDGESYSLTASARSCTNSEMIYLDYIYLQSTPDPAACDEGLHMGAASLCFDPNDKNTLSGTYWTRRSWRQGLNTAGKIYLTRIHDIMPSNKKLKHLASEHKKQ